jgi:transposase-like protein
MIKEIRLVTNHLRRVAPSGAKSYPQKEAEAMSTTKQPTTAAKQEWWCNFCDYKTTDQAAYLAHSCAEELKKKGQSVAPGDKKHCG